MNKRNLERTAGGFVEGIRRALFEREVLNDTGSGHLRTFCTTQEPLFADLNGATTWTTNSNKFQLHLKLDL
jgi:hypothetical protein